MTDRLKSLARIESVQKRLVALADIRLAAAEKICRNLADDQTRLRNFVADDTLSPALAKATLRSGYNIERNLRHATSLRDRQKDHRDGLKRREHALGAMVDAEKIISRRQEEDRDLREVLDAWLARENASLP